MALPGVVSRCMSTSTPEPSTALLTIPEAAAQLRCSRATVYRLLNAELLPYVRVGSLTRIERSALERYITGLRRAS